MTFAAPFFAWAAGVVALATVALHLLAWRRPPASPLPTARFAPEAPIRTVSRAVRPADLALLALRVFVVLLLGAALAGPLLSSREPGTARVIVVDGSRASAGNAAVRDAAGAQFRTGDALVVFDSVAREVNNPSRDSVGAVATAAAGSLSAALIGAIRAARRLARERDSVEIVIVSPFAAAEVDAATTAIRRMWPGVVRALRVGSPPDDTARAATPDVRATAGDGVAAALSLLGDVRRGADVRVVRDAMTSADSAWARAGHAVVVWPSMPASSGWVSRPSSDTSFGVSVIAGRLGSTRSLTVVAPFVRAVQPPFGRVLARWQDGEPAATEVSLGGGCVRSVAVAPPAAGDVWLTPAFRRFAEAFVGPCGGGASRPALSDSAIAALVRPAVSPDSAANIAAVGAPAPPRSLAAWLLGLALLASLGELALRRRATDATA